MPKLVVPTWAHARPGRPFGSLAPSNLFGRNLEASMDGGDSREATSYGTDAQYQWH